MTGSRKYWTYFLLGVSLFLIFLNGSGALSRLPQPPEITSFTRTAGIVVTGVFGLETAALAVLRALGYRRGKQIRETYDPAQNRATIDSTIDTLGPFPPTYYQIIAELKHYRFEGPERELGWVMGTQERIPMWRYHNANATIEALVSYDKVSKSVSATLWTHFEDGASLATNFPKLLFDIHHPDFDFESVASVDAIYQTHHVAVAALTHEHGKTLSLPTQEDRDKVEARVWKRNSLAQMQAEGKSLIHVTLTQFALSLMIVGFCAYVLTAPLTPRESGWVVVVTVGLIPCIAYVWLFLRDSAAYLRRTSQHQIAGNAR